MKTLILATTPLLNKSEDLQRYYREEVMQTIIDAAPEGSEVELVYASEVSEEETLELMKNGVTHLIIPGGEDVTPSFYNGATTYEGSGNHNETADISQIAAVKYAVDNDIAVFGICRGLQILNTALGGTLHQHVEGHNKTLEKGEKDYEKRFTEHAIVSKVEHPAIDTFSMVHCAHHQTIDQLGEGLEALATQVNGHIEAVHVPESPAKIFAVQYHPEASSSRSTHLKNISQWFYS